MKALGLVQISVLAAAAALLASPVLAQDQAPPAAPAPATQEALAGGIVWEASPDSADFARVYPRGARADEIDGRAALDCVFDDRGRVTCTLLSEEPAGHGFGEAALRLAREFRAAPETSNGVPVAGRRTQLSLGFEIARLPRGCPEGRRFC